MSQVEVSRLMAPADAAATSALLRAARRAGGHRFLAADRDGTGLLAREAGRPEPVGFAQVSGDAGGWAIELVVDPGVGPDRSSWGSLLRASVDVVRRDGGGPVRVWVHGATAEHDRIAEAAGLSAERDLYMMRRRLPVHEVPTLITRPFVVGRDEQAWLDVNNRAFAGHPDQGGWTPERLARIESEPWFDPDGFRLHERNGRLAGFCWTKVHDDVEPAVGELYVVGVDPDFQGHGLGRELVATGLDRLSRSREKELEWVILYVDASNRGAVHLYKTMGFAVHHVDRAYAGVVTPINEPST